MKPDSSYTSREGMQFSYYQGWDTLVARFNYGSATLRIHCPLARWQRMTHDEQHRWRQAKYAEAERFFGIKRRST